MTMLDDWSRVKAIFEGALAHQGDARAAYLAAACEADALLRQRVEALIFTSRFFRDNADPGLLAHFNEMQRLSADPETAARYQESTHSRGDGRAIYAQVRTPTLIVHARDDEVVGFEEGRRLAALIPGAQLVVLPGGSHYFPTDEQSAARVVDAIDRFA